VTAQQAKQNICQSVMFLVYLFPTFTVGIEIDCREFKTIGRSYIQSSHMQLLQFSHLHMSKAQKQELYVIHIKGPKLPANIPQTGKIFVVFFS